MEDKSALKRDESLGNLHEYSLAKIISYSTVWFTDSMILAFFGVVVFYFYEVEVGLNVIYVAIAFVIFAIWNMLNDPLLGFLSERPRSEKSVMKYGFRTPWLIISAILMVIVFFFVFLPPTPEEGASQMMIFIYMVILVCLVDACYTIYNSNFAAGHVNIFRTDEQRRKLSASALIMSTIGVLITNAIILPNIINPGERQSFVLAAGITAIAMAINIIVFTHGIREPHDVKLYYLKGRDKDKSETVSFLPILKTSLKNKNFIMYIIAFLFWSVAFNLFYASQIYLYKDVLRIDFSNFMYAFLAFFIGFITTIPFWIKMAKKYGNANIYGLGYILIGIMFFGVLWISNLLEIIILMLIGGFFYAASASILVAVQADPYDEVTADLGVHQEATLQGITNIFIRIAYLIVGIVIAVVHIYTNYNPDPGAAQSALAILGIRLHTGVIPGIFCIAGGLSFLIIYDLKGEKILEVREKLKKIIDEKI